SRGHCAPCTISSAKEPAKVRHAPLTVLNAIWPPRSAHFHDRCRRTPFIFGTKKETDMKRRLFLAGVAATVLFPRLALPQSRHAPSFDQIMRQLDRAPRRHVRPEERVTIQELHRRPDLRRIAPSIDVQAINFEFGSAESPRSE